MALAEDVTIVALGTSAVATAQMLKAGANKGASGENALCKGISEADCIVGPIAVTWANAMLGEVTPRMATAITSSPAPKILIPLSQKNVHIVGMSGEPHPHLVQQALLLVKEVLQRV